MKKIIFALTLFLTQVGLAETAQIHFTNASSVDFEMGYFVKGFGHPDLSENFKFRWEHGQKFVALRSTTDNQNITYSFNFKTERIGDLVAINKENKNVSFAIVGFCNSAASNNPVIRQLPAKVNKSQITQSTFCLTSAQTTIDMGK
ncbi:MAG: hypothetical protein ACOYOK_06625 [Pseudobdellovibrionaceae bacterium]